MVVELCVTRGYAYYYEQLSDLDKISPAFTHLLVLCLIFLFLNNSHQSALLHVGMAFQL